MWYFPSTFLCNFYPRPPRGGRRHARRHPKVEQQFLSTPSARRATAIFVDVHQYEEISIHALREEGDGILSEKTTETEKFLSTPSARRATASRRSQEAREHYFYPRPPRGGRHLAEQRGQAHFVFLSTPSARRAT